MAIVAEVAVMVELAVMAIHIMAAEAAATAGPVE